MGAEEFGKASQLVLEKPQPLRNYYATNHGPLIWDNTQDLALIILVGANFSY